MRGRRRLAFRNDVREKAKQEKEKGGGGSDENAEGNEESIKQRKARSIILKAVPEDELKPVMSKVERYLRDNGHLSPYVLADETLLRFFATKKTAARSVGGRLTANEVCRLLHVIADPSMRAEIMKMRKGLSREQLDDKGQRCFWKAICREFNDKEVQYASLCDEHELCKNIDPNIFFERRDIFG